MSVRLVGRAAEACFTSVTADPEHFDSCLCLTAHVGLLDRVYSVDSLVHLYV